MSLVGEALEQFKAARARVLEFNDAIFRLSGELEHAQKGYADALNASECARNKLQNAIDDDARASAATARESRLPF